MTTNAAERLTGIVKSYNDARGYGFILPDDGGLDLFVHVNALQRSGIATLQDGERVSFRLGPRGRPRAIDLQLLDD